MARKSQYEKLFTHGADGRWRKMWTDANGKRHDLRDTDPDRLYERWQAALAQKAVVPTFCEVLDQWEQEVWDTIKPSTQASYAKPVQRARNELGAQPLDKIEPYMIQRALDRMASQHLSVSTIKTQRVIYRQLFRYAINDQHFGKFILRNPADTPEIPGNAKKPVLREAPEEDVVQLIQASAGTAYWGQFALLLLCTGFRRGEALGLQWQDVDLNSGWITCRQQAQYYTGQTGLVDPKRDSARRVPILAPLRPYLQPPKGAKATDFVFPGEDPAKPMPYSGYKRHWAHYCKDIGQDITAHQLRHGYATMLYEAGIDEFTAQSLMGHKDIETTHKVYTHLRDRKKAAAVEDLLQKTAEGLIIKKDPEAPTGAPGIQRIK